MAVFLLGGGTMPRYQNELVISFRIGSPAELSALDRIAASRKQTRSEILRSFVRKILEQDLEQKVENGKQHA